MEKNTGNENTGRGNTGNNNTGGLNSGSYNKGDWNTGNENFGYGNSASHNIGNGNSGNSNTGNNNTGSFNVGNFNTGSFNVGDGNTGRFNCTDYSTGFFCTTPEYPELFDKAYPSLTITEIEAALPTFFSTFSAVRPSVDEQGNIYPYSSESTQWGWNMLQKEEQETLLDLEAFDVAKFLACTGIDVRLDDSPSFPCRNPAQDRADEEASAPNASTEKNNTGKGNTGNNNIGDHNVGNGNIGDCNTGDHNDGNSNVANWNFGHHNAGDSNVGNYNTGRENEGKFNTGNFNIGSYNSGNYNIGANNAGDHNNGNRNIGHWNKTSNCCGFFCTEPKTVRMFDVDTGLSFEDASATIPDFLVGLMILARDGASSIQEIYNKRVSEEEKEQIKSMPNFDAKIFKQCTGIDVGK